MKEETTDIQKAIKRMKRRERLSTILHVVFVLLIFGLMIEWFFIAGMLADNPPNWAK